MKPEYSLEIPYDLKFSTRTGLYLESWRAIYKELLEASVIWQQRLFSVSVLDSTDTVTVWLFDSTGVVAPEFRICISGYLPEGDKLKPLGIYGCRRRAAAGNTWPCKK